MLSHFQTELGKDLVLNPLLFGTTGFLGGDCINGSSLCFLLAEGHHQVLTVWAPMAGKLITSMHESQKDS